MITTYDDGTLSSNESNQDSDASVCQNDQERGGKTMAETQQIHSVSPVINMIHTEQGERRLHISPSSDQHSKRQDIHQSTRQAQPRQQPKPMQLQREERHQSYYQESDKQLAQE